MSTEITEIVGRITDGISFWLYYDLLQNEWHTSTTTISGVADMSQVPFVYAPTNGTINSNWANYPNSGLLYIDIASNNQVATTTYDLTARGRVYIFESYRDVRFYWEPGQIIIDNASGLALQDTIEIMPFVNTNDTVNNNEPVITDPTTSFLKVPVNFNISGVFIQDDGFQDDSKVKVSLVDANNDGIADDPTGFDRIVTLQDRIVFEYYTNEISGYQSTRPWIARWGTALEYSTNIPYVYFPIDPNQVTQLYGSPYISNTLIIDPLNPTSIPGATVMYMDQYDLLFIEDSIVTVTINTEIVQLTQMEYIANQLTAFYNGPTAADLLNYPWLANTEYVNDPNKQEVMSNYFLNKAFLLSNTPPGFGVYNAFEYQDTSNLNSYPKGKILISVVDQYHFDKNGKIFTQNTTIPQIAQLPFYFKWSHYSPIDQRVDPSATNIIDMIVITDGYYTDVVNWKNSNGTAATLPVKPTTEELRIQFQGLDQYKMVSDSMIWNSGEFKLLFGAQAATELQAIFKVVKAPSNNISDNEVKTLVIQAIDVYFDIRNWDFGETFFYTELAAFIHQQLSNAISSVVIVPTNASSQFGNLFEIVAGPNQLFLSTATVNNVSIVANLTNQNMRV